MSHLRLLGFILVAVLILLLGDALDEMASTGNTTGLTGVLLAQEAGSDDTAASDVASEDAITDSDDTGIPADSLFEPVEEKFSIQEAISSLKRKYRAGGTTMHFLLLFSLIALAFILERTFRLRRGRTVPRGLAFQADRLWNEGKYDEIDALCRKRRSTLSKIILFTVRHRNNPISDVSAGAGDIAARDMGYHQILAYPLAAVAAIAPLLGLFGTVLGMMETFETVAVSGQMGQAKALAGGISKALVTTAFGLFVAIPALFFFNVFRMRTRLLANLLEEQGGTLINEWLLEKENTSKS